MKIRLLPALCPGALPMLNAGGVPLGQRFLQVLEFRKKLDGAGIKLDGKGYIRAKNMDLAICLITDP